MVFKCSPVSEMSIISSQLPIQMRTKYHLADYINSIPFSKNSNKICLFTSQRAEEVSEIGLKKQLLVQNKSDAEELTSYVSLYYTSEMNLFNFE